MAKRDQTQEPLDAVRHPIRRSLLRHFLESTEMLSPKELSDLENESLSMISDHVRELDKLGAIEIAGGQHFYLPTRGSRGRVQESPMSRAGCRSSAGRLEPRRCAIGPSYPALSRERQGCPVST
jgi:hypothetical protein